MRTALVLLLVNLASAVVLPGQQGESADPVQKAKLAVVAAEREHGPAGVIATKARLALAKELFRQGQLVDAEQAVHACVTAFEALLPDAEIELSEALLVTGAIAGQRQDLVTAEAFYRRALAIRERLEPDGSAYVQLLRFNLAATLQQVSDYRGGLELAELGRRAAERKAGADSQMVGHFSVVAALCLGALGRNAEAYEGFVRAERILKSTRGESYPDALRMAGLAGATACQLGRPTEGLAKIADTLDAMRKVPQLNPEILLELRVADVVLRVLYRRDAAASDDLRKMLLELLTGPTSNGRDVHLLKVMSALGDIDPLVIDLAAAKRGLAACEKELGPDSVYLAGMLSNMARLLISAGKMEAAESYARRATAIVDASPWFVAPDRWKIQCGMARWLCRSGDTAGAIARVQLSLAEVPRLLDAWSSPLDEHQRLEFAASVRTAVDFQLSLAEQVGLPAVERWRAVLAWKGMVSRGLLQSLEWLHRNHDPDAQRLAGDLRAAVGRWSALVRCAAPVEAIDAARQAREAIERQLEHHLASRPIDVPPPAAIAAALAADEVLVDFFTFGHTSRVKDPEAQLEERLLAFVVRRGESPVLVELGPLAPVTEAVQAFLQIASRWTRPVAGADELVASAGASLAALVWAPLQQHIPAGSKVLVCPDSVVALVPFACLPGTTAGTFLLEDYEFTYVATAADLVRRAAPMTRGNECRLLAIGDVDYGERLASAERRDAARDFPPLPGSAAEVEAIMAMRAGGPPSSTVVLHGRDATAERFAAEAPGASILHVATHGWYRGSRALPDASRRWAAFESPGKSLPEGVLAPGADCGIAFADANRPTNAEGDGVLTADELALLDLGSCELAVLSACDTALGTISAGDGLLGLRRSLRLAGATRSLTSVWRVDDAATQRCMQAFYEELWQRERAPAAALRAAQLAMLRRAREAGGQALVGTWGAFVLESR
jgi:CHAT domain-containing protein/tetratricopeptide (TPR) repeat protein